MNLEVIKEDITKLEVEAIVNPANSMITMGGGLSGVIRRVGGKGIQEEARKFAPVKVGKAVITSAGKLQAKYIIHAPTMEKPSMKVGKENAGLAMRAILECAEENEISEVAVPGLGTGVGGVDYEEAAMVMIDEIKRYKGKNIKKVIFVAYNDELLRAFQKATTNYVLLLTRSIT